MAGSYFIPVSGALAAEARLANSARNVANLRSVGNLPGATGAAAIQEPFAPSVPVQSAVAGAAGAGSGTRVVFRPANPGFIAQFVPDSPVADGNGLVAAPAVDPIGETVEQIGSLRAFQANLAVIQTQDELQRKVIDSFA